MFNRKKGALTGIIAHRGAPNQYPENSVAGYKAVLNLALLHPTVPTFMEVDVRATRATDQHPAMAVALHDETLDRTLTGYEGRFDELDYGDFSKLCCKSDAGLKPIDFEHMRGKSNYPFHPIISPDDHGPGDYRPTAIAELLELTWKTNQTRAKSGTPVGICFDLKDPTAFPALAKEIDDFAKRHPNDALPMMTLAIVPLVNKKELRGLWNMLTPEARLFFYETPVDEQHILRKANLHTNLGKGAGMAVKSSITSAVSNQFFPWHMMGDPDPSKNQSLLGAAGKTLAGNFIMLDSEKEIRRAEKRQHLIWTDEPGCAMRTLETIQREREEGRYIAAR